MFEVIFATEKDNLKPYIDLKDVPSGLEKEMRDFRNRVKDFFMSELYCRNFGWIAPSQESERERQLT